MEGRVGEVGARAGARETRTGDKVRGLQKAHPHSKQAGIFSHFPTTRLSFSA